MIDNVPCAITRSETIEVKLVRHRKQFLDQDRKSILNNSSVTVMTMTPITAFTTTSVKAEPGETIN